MEIEKSSSFFQLMKNDLVRRHILNIIPSFYDVSSLSNTCKQIASWIEEGKIEKNMMLYSDVQRITIKIKENVQENSNLSSLENIEFEIDEDSYETINEAKKFVGETILEDNRISFMIFNFVEKIKKRECNLFVKKLVEKMELNIELRKHSSILNLSTDLSNNNTIIIRALCFMHHENIRRIEISQNTLLLYNNSYINTSEKFFNGFPKFHELLIYGSIPLDNYTNLIKNKSLIKQILKELSSRINPTLILKISDWGYHEIGEYIHMIMELASNYKIKVKCDALFISSLLGRKNIIHSIEKSDHFLMTQIIFSVSVTVQNFDFFVNTMKNLEFFKNLEILEFNFWFFDIKESLVKKRLSSLSLQFLDKLKNVKFDFSDYLSEEDNLRTITFNNNLQQLSLFMPKNIERLTLVDGFELSEKTAKTMNKYMPNIKILVMNGVSYKDYNCFNDYKNLQAFISFQNLPIEIPNTTNFLFIGNKSCWFNNSNDDNMSEENEELLNNYSERFSKKICHDNDYIFFNGIRQWNLYKNVLQNIIY